MTAPDVAGGRRGAVIAFVGSEATGKSTIVAATEGWLRERYEVETVHAGKPPSTALTLVPHFLLPALRILFPDKRSTRIEASREDADRGGKEAYPLLFALRSVMLAHERRTLLLRAFARAADGRMVLTDRYPSSTTGAPDGPQLAPAPPGRPSLKTALARLETRLYDGIPAPDLVIHLSSPLAVALARNAGREKREPEDYVRRRHSLASRLRFDGAKVHRVETDRPLETVVEDVRAAVTAFLESLPASRPLPSDARGGRDA